MKTFNKGFSLIELLVVVTIVSLLAAVAVPAYKDYSVKSKINALVPIMSTYVKYVEQYYIRTGTWPQAVNLPNVTASSNTTIANPSTISPYLTSIRIDRATAAGCSAANQSTVIWFTISSTAIGYGSTFPSGNVTMTIGQQIYTTNNGTVFGVRSGLNGGGFATCCGGITDKWLAPMPFQYNLEDFPPSCS